MTNERDTMMNKKLENEVRSGLLQFALILRDATEEQPKIVAAICIWASFWQYRDNEKLDALFERLLPAAAQVLANCDRAALEQDIAGRWDNKDDRWWLGSANNGLLTAAYSHAPDEAARRGISDWGQGKLDSVAGNAELIQELARLWLRDHEEVN